MVDGATPVPGNPGKVYVVRHAESAGNVALALAESHGERTIGLDGRDADTPLSGLGHTQASALGAWFASLPKADQPEVILSSPFTRAFQTAAAVAGALGMDENRIEVDERLREKEFGIFDGFTRAGVEARFPELAAQRTNLGKFYFRPPGGESWCDVIMRLRAVIESGRLDGLGRRVLLVGHQVAFYCLRYIFEQMREADLLATDRLGLLPNCAVAEYDVVFDGARRFALRRDLFVPPGV